MNVAVLRLNIRLDQLGRERTRLRADNAQLASQLSERAGGGRGSRRSRASELGRPPALAQRHHVRPAEPVANERPPGEPPDPPAPRRSSRSRSRSRSAARSGSRSCGRRRSSGWPRSSTTRRSTTPAGRGTIYDRMGVQLAIGEQATTVYANPRQVRNPQRVAVAARPRARRSTRTRSTRSCSTGSRASSTSSGKADPERAAALQRSGTRRARLLPRGAARRTRSTRSARRCSATRASTTRASPGSSSRSSTTSPASRARRRSSATRSAARSTSLSSTPERAGPRRLPHARPHAPGEGRVGAALDGREVARDGRRPRSCSTRRPAACSRWRPRPASTRTTSRARAEPLQRNRAVTDTYEPGSTFKVVTVRGRALRRRRHAELDVHAAAVDQGRRPRRSTRPSRGRPRR